MQILRSLKIQFVIFLITSCASVFLSSNAHAEKLNAEETIYLKTKELCQSGRWNSIVAKGEVFYHSFTEAGAISTLVDYFQSSSFKQHKMNSQLEELINSDGYWAAIHDCFGHDEFKAKSFFIGLLATDLLGKVSSWAFDITMIRAFILLSRTIYAASFAELPQRFMWSWVILSLASKNRSILSKLSDITMVSAMIGSLVANNRFDYRVSQKIVSAELEKNDSALMQLHKENEEYRTLMNRASPEKQKVLRMFIAMNENSIQMLQQNYKKF